MRAEYRIQSLTEEGLKRELVFLKAEEDRANAFQSLKRTNGGKFLKEYLSDHLEWIRKRYKALEPSSPHIAIAITANQVEEILVEELLQKVTGDIEEILDGIVFRRTAIGDEMKRRKDRIPTREFLPSDYKTKENQ